MTISYVHGDLLQADVDALVNAVNCVGVMGKGIALAFKNRFPANYRAYASACQQGQVRTGTMFVTWQDVLVGPRWIINFPTKRDWRAPSQLAWIVSGLQDLRRFLVDEQVASVAIPALGAGNGGLDWPSVRNAIEHALGDLDVDIRLFEPLNNAHPAMGAARHAPAGAPGGRA
jgi:O-acetyl-ADP-ribose deacetylase (regulator of RNase III)